MSSITFSNHTNINNKVEKYVPLDGKTIFKTENLEKLVKNTHSETKTAIDKNTVILWQEHREKIFNIIADLLKDQDKNTSSPTAQNLHERIATKINKKGRPKKKQNPWQHIIDRLEEDTEDSSREEITENEDTTCTSSEK